MLLKLQQVSVLQDHLHMVYHIKGNSRNHMYKNKQFKISDLLIFYKKLKFIGIGSS